MLESFAGTVQEQRILNKLGMYGLVPIGYGRAAQEFFKLADINNAIEELGNADLIVTIYDEGDDSIDFYGGTHKKGKSVEEILWEMADDESYEVGDFEKLKNIEDLKSWYCGYFERFDGCHLVSINTETEELSQRQLEEFARLERIAQGFASECKKGIGTFAFIKELEQELHRVRSDRDIFNFEECKMEMHAACMYAGVGTSVYFDDLNFENGRYSNRIDDLKGVFHWLEQECPLLMAKYQEMKLSGVWETAHE